MNVSINFDFFLSAKSEKSKETTVKRIAKALDEEFIGCIMQGKERRFQVNTYCESWELAVCRVLRACQSFGRQWILTGDISSEFSAWTNHPKIIGVESIGVNADNPTATIKTPE